MLIELNTFCFQLTRAGRKGIVLEVSSKSEKAIRIKSKGFASALSKLMHVRLRGAMVARLTPDQKAACSNHVGVNCFALL